MQKSQGSLEKLLRRRTGTLIQKFGLIQQGDKIAIGLSGGKDSLVLLRILAGLRRAAPVDFDLHALIIDPGIEEFTRNARNMLIPFGEELGVPVSLIPTTIAEIAFNSEEAAQGSQAVSPCFMCARLRRGVLVTEAQKLGCGILALGHHGNDSMETLLMNMLFSGVTRAMPPWYRAERGMMVIRPLLTCLEEDIRDFAELCEMPIVDCPCPGKERDLMRQRMKVLLAGLTEDHGRRVLESAVGGLGNLKPETFSDIAHLGRRPS